jgi:hypothetical protein
MILLSEVMNESKASDQAKKLGLDYMSFGRYGKNGKTTHKSQGDKLVPIAKKGKTSKGTKVKKTTPPEDSTYHQQGTHDQGNRNRHFAGAMAGDYDSYEGDDDTPNPPRKYDWMNPTMGKPETKEELAHFKLHQEYNKIESAMDEIRIKIEDLQYSRQPNKKSQIAKLENKFHKFDDASDAISQAIFKLTKAQRKKMKTW